MGRKKLFINYISKFVSLQEKWLSYAIEHWASAGVCCNPEHSRGQGRKVESSRSVFIT